MKQPIRRKKSSSNKAIVNKKKPSKGVRGHQKFGTSKLELDFARDFLDKLGVRYIWQFEAKDIGRFYDFYITDHNLIIEVDGGFYHSDPRVVDENKLNPMQKRNKRVDELKNRWALMHGIPILRIWEKDIRETPEKVMNVLKERLDIAKTEVILKENKNKRHVNKIK